jgi:hypothetical protein
VMALITTFMATPLLDVFCPDKLVWAGTDRALKWQKAAVPQLDMDVTGGSAA